MESIGQEYLSTLTEQDMNDLLESCKKLIEHEVMMQNLVMSLLPFYKLA